MYWIRSNIFLLPLVLIILAIFLSCFILFYLFECCLVRFPFRTHFHCQKKTVSLAEFMFRKCFLFSSQFRSFKLLWFFLFFFSVVLFLFLLLKNAHAHAKWFIYRWFKRISWVVEQYCVSLFLHLFENVSHYEWLFGWITITLVSFTFAIGNFNSFVHLSYVSFSLLCTLWMMLWIIKQHIWKKIK